MKVLSQNIIMKNQKGTLTIDFLLAFIIVFFFVLILLKMSFTLTSVEITQYVTFSSARTYFAGHKTLKDQRELALKKYQTLTQETERLRPYFNNGWFIVGGQPGDKDAPVRLGTAGKTKMGTLARAPNSSFDQIVGNDTYSEQASDGDKRYFFVGAWVNFQAKVLQMTVPFLGESYENENSFMTIIGSYLGREPNASECMGYNETRAQALQRFYSSVATGEFLPLTDNGC